MTTIENHQTGPSPHRHGSAPDLEARLGSIIAVSQRSERDEGELLEHALNEAVCLTDSRFGCVYTWSEESRQLSLGACSRDVVTECRVTGQRSERMLESAGLWAEAVRQRQPVIVNDYVTNPTARGLPAGHVGITRFLAVPVFNGGEVRAVVAVANRTAPYDE
ncbi:MAG TPA: GAF domain-containing protein, partial [Spirochaetia bacterium]